MDKRNTDRRQDRRQDQRGKRYDQKGRRGGRSELGTLGDLPQNPKSKETKQQQQKNDNKSRCAFCGGQLKARGPVGHAGHLRWKCRKCGRTVWVRPEYKIPEPLVPTSKMARSGGTNVHMRRMQERVNTGTNEPGVGVT